MSAPTTFADGTVTTDGTEQILHNFTSATPAAGIVKLVLDTTNMASGNTTIIRAYKKSSGGNLRKFVETTYTNAQTVPLKETDPLSFAHATQLKVTIQRTAGTDRAYDWSLESF